MKEIKLTQNKIALVDDDDFERVSEHKWHVAGTYAHSTAVGLMHRFILKLTTLGKRARKRTGELNVDHINGVGIDNRKINLRLCTHQENHWNNKGNQKTTSGYKGVSRASGGKWESRIRVNNKKLHIGLFEDKHSAAQAYNEAAKKYHGEFARLNIIMSEH